jgi:hypothetical protein
MRTLLALAALLASGTPNLAKLVLKPAQVGHGYLLLLPRDGTSVSKTAVTLNICGRAGYPSETLRVARLQVDYLKRKSPIGLSNELVTYKPGGAAQAMREVARHADTCPSHAIDTGEPGLPPLRFTITRMADKNLLKGYLAIKVRARGVVKGKQVDQTSYAVYQRLGNVLSGTYSFGANTPAQLALALHAAEQSAHNLLASHNGGSPTA